VRVTASRRDSSVVIEVADDGDGIAPADLERVFEAGVRATAERPGSGLGLSIVRTVARAHGGEVTVTSEPGRGSTFRLELPGACGGG
jgi:signal transduction histidine kinase